MDKDNSSNNKLSIKSTILGKDNTANFLQIDTLVVNVRSDHPDSTAIAQKIASDVRGALEEEFGSSHYNILLCYPNKKINDQLVIDAIENIKSKLVEIGAMIYEGGGKSILPKTEVTYPHLAELEFIKITECDTVIIFVFDEITISQLSLISHFKISNNIDRTDIIIISSPQFKNSDQFISSGAFQYCEDKGCKLMDLETLDEIGVKSIATRITNKKIIQRRGGLLGV